MRKKIIYMLTCLILIVSILPAWTQVAAQKIQIKGNGKILEKNKILLENKTVNITVYRIDENNNTVPVSMAFVYVYVYPQSLPWFWDNTDANGNLHYMPEVYVGYDMKINAYHEWYGGCIIYHSIKSDDPDPIHFDMILDPSISIKQDHNYQPLLNRVSQRLINVLQMFSLLHELFIK